MRLQPFVIIITLFALCDLSLADDKSTLKLEVSIVNNTVKICLTNPTQKSQSFYNGFKEHRHSNVPAFTYLILRRKDGSIITSRYSEDGRYSPSAYSSFEFKWSDIEQQTLGPGESISYSAPLGRFLYRPPWQYRFGFSWAKLGCRVYTKAPNEYVEAETDWAEVDYEKVLQDAAD